MKWIKGEPDSPMWCLATYLTNDDPPRKSVVELWFNAQAIHKWWIGSAGDVKEFLQPVTHWMGFPSPPEDQEEEGGKYNVYFLTTFEEWLGIDADSNQEAIDKCCLDARLRFERPVYWIADKQEVGDE